jgi:hypothetical protein
MSYSTAASSFPQYWDRLYHEDGAESLLRQEYEKQQALFQLQPVTVQRHFEAQAGQIAAEISRDASQIKFDFPDQITVPDPDADQTQPLSISANTETICGGVVEAHG